MSINNINTFCELSDKYLRREITFEYFNDEIIKNCDNFFLESENVINIYHALQHYDLDSDIRESNINFEEKINYKLKLIIESFSKNSLEDLKVHLSDYFSI